MPTALYDALVAKTRDWSNKPEANTIPDSVIQDCLKYSADECYRVLRIPPLEATVTYTVTAGDNLGDNGTGGTSEVAYTAFAIPSDLTQFVYVRTLAATNSNVSIVFDEIADSRTFFDAYAEKYSRYNWMWQGEKLFVHPQLAVGDVLEIHYYRRLPALDAVYAVDPVNYVVGVSDSLQPYLTVGTAVDTALYFALGIPYATNAEAVAFGAVTVVYFVGKEVPNWLRDSNERLLMWGAMQHLGAYLFDNSMEQRYEKRFIESVQALNKEEKWRKASGGNVQININTGGLI